MLASVQKHKKVTPETAALAERDGPCVFDVDGEAGAARLARWGEAPSGVSVALAEAWDDAARRGAGGHAAGCVGRLAFLALPGTGGTGSA